MSYEYHYQHLLSGSALQCKQMMVLPEIAHAFVVAVFNRIQNDKYPPQMEEMKCTGKRLSMNVYVRARKQSVKNHLVPQITFKENRI